MLCDVCKDSLEGMWDPLRTKRLELRENFSIFKDLEDSSRSLEESSVSEVEKEVERYVFGHHETRNSFLRSRAAGCVQCSRYPSDHHRGKLGYFSVFSVRFEAKGRILVDLCCGDHRNTEYMVPCGGNAFLVRR